MSPGKFLDGKRGLDPEKIDRAVNAPSILKRYRHSGQTVIIRRRTVRPSYKARIANAKAPRTCLRKNLLKLSWVTCEPIFRQARSAQPLQNSIPLAGRAERQIGPANASQQPVH